MKVNNKEYKIIKLLGKGKSGYSYLACCEDVFYTLKKIHHEPCDYYTFTNKIESELRDYQTLSKLNILMPELIDVDKENEIIVKEYLTGKTVLEKISADEDISLELKLIKEIAEHLKNNNINIDYYPSNFILQSNRLYYVDYECNEYMVQYDFDNWGIKYWFKSEDLLEK
ncbi:MAG: hypothetical protein QM204_01485 [Bacillota bacterium]|jgi:tRNA A-37 threonylcarbamoyl transferase component Bud32|nr:hypothetical protein [Bacillota bacterium]NLL26615.1 hypothetical protein [Erysipelotrichia bacterium]